MAYDDKLKINIVPIDPSTHKLLIDTANRQGVALNEYLGQKADEWAATLEPTETELQDHNRRVYWNFVKSERKRSNRRKLNRMAAEYCEYPTEESADLLLEQCELLDVDFDEIVSKIRRNPYSSIVAGLRKNTKFDDCATWLSQLFAERGEIVVSVLKVLAHGAGFNWTMVNRVRSHFNDDLDTPYIISIKKGKGWSWELQEPFEEEDQHDQLHPIYKKDY